MIRHVFAGTVKDGVSEEKAQELVDAWNALPGKISEVVSLTAGKNLGLVDDKISVALIADFENEKDLMVYMEHPDHKQVGQELTSVIIEPSSRVVAQIEIK